LRGLGSFFGGLKVLDEEIALVFEKATVADVQATCRGFLTDCPDAVSLARRFPYRVVEKYDGYLADDLTAQVFSRERLDLDGAIHAVFRNQQPGNNALSRRFSQTQNQHRDQG
jgi:hypothetical protein